MGIEQNRTEFYSDCGRLYILLAKIQFTSFWEYVMHGPRKFFRGVQLFLRLVNQTNNRTYLKSNAETNTTKIGSSSARKRNAMLMAFRWHGPRKFFQRGSTFFTVS